MALKKESFVSNKRQTQHKRHVRNQWTHGHAARAVDGDADQTLHSCTLLDNFYVDKPIWMVDLVEKTKVSGVIVYTWQGKGESELLYIAIINMDSRQTSAYIEMNWPDFVIGFLA